MRIPRGTSILLGDCTRRLCGVGGVPAGSNLMIGASGEEIWRGHKIRIILEMAG